nr:hypothetical protein [Tanacetum cinerariifolium]
ILSRNRRKRLIKTTPTTKSHDYKGKGKEIKELDNDADRLPIPRGYHELDLNDPIVKADIEET